MGKMEKGLFVFSNMSSDVVVVVVVIVVPLKNVLFRSFFVHSLFCRWLKYIPAP
jgi:hypothetical protein